MHGRSSHQEEKHAGITAEKRRKEGSETKRKKIVLEASIGTELPISATKPSRVPCHPICHLLPILVDSGIKCQYCRCRPPPLRQQINEKTNKTTRSRGLYVATQTPLVGRTGTLLHDVTSLRHPLAVLLSHFAASICLHPRPLRACTKPQPGVSPPRRSPLVSDTW